MFFRNLDGNGTLLKEIDLRGKTIVNKSTVTSTTAASSTIIQSFTFEMSVDGEVISDAMHVPAEWLISIQRGRAREPGWLFRLGAGGGIPLSYETRTGEGSDSREHFLGVTTPRFRAVIEARYTLDERDD